MKYNPAAEYWEKRARKADQSHMRWFVISMLLACGLALAVSQLLSTNHDCVQQETQQ